MGLTTGKKATSTTAAALAASELAHDVTLIAPSANSTDIVYVGVSSGASAANGYPLEAGDSVTLYGPVDLASIYVVASANTPAIHWVGTV